MEQKQRAKNKEQRAKSKEHREIVIAEVLRSSYIGAEAEARSREQ